MVIKLNRAMQVKHISLLVLLCLLISGTASSQITVFSAGAFAYPDGVYILVNESVPTDELSLSDVRDVFTINKQHWSDGTKITVFVLPNSSDIHKAFCRQHLQLFPYQLDRLWNHMTYSGQGDRPIRLDSEQQLIQAVMSTPGAIGYARQKLNKVNTTTGDIIL